MGKVEITEEDCSDMEVREDHAVSAGTSVPFDVEEAGAVIRITAAADPDYCRTETGHYDSKQMDYSDGGVCLSHKQIPRKEGLSEDSPYGTLGSPNSAQCIEDNSGIDVTSVYGTKTACEAVAGHTWIDFVNTNKRTDGGKCYKSSDDSLQTGSVCVKDGVILDMNETFCAVQLGEYVDLSVRENCEKVNAFEWVETDVSFGYVTAVSTSDMSNLQGQTLSFANVNHDHYTINGGSEEDPTLKLCAGDTYAIERATAGHALNIKLGEVDQLSADVTEGNSQTWTPASGTYQYYCVSHPTAMLGNLIVEDCSNLEKIEWEDSRLSCAHMGTSSGKSKYDRIRMTFFVDLLIGKDLFDEGKA